MVSGTFHITSAEWRYFSREKSIVHTSHFGQVPPYVTGQSVFITPIPPTGTGNNGFSGGNKFSVPVVTPYQGLNINNVTNNIPPLWQYGFNFDGANSGTNGFSGTFYWPVATLRNVEQQWWPATGGTFLFLGHGEPTINNSQVLDTLEVDLYNATTNPAHLSFPILQQGHYFVRIAGDSWNNLFYVTNNGGTVDASMIDTISPFSNLAMYLQPSSFLDDGFGFSSYSTLIMRLGP
jgi:hypothetical protein